MADYIHLFETQADFISAVTNDYHEPWVSYTMETSAVSFNGPEIPQHDYSQDYLTFNIISGGAIVFSCDNASYAKTIQYSKNDGEWTNMTSTVDEVISTAITVSGLSGIFIYGGYDDDKNAYFWENNGTKLYNAQARCVIEYIVYDDEYNEYSVLTVQNQFVDGTKIDVVGGDTIKFRGDNLEYNNNTFGDSSAVFTIEGNIMSLIDDTGFTTATTLASGSTFGNLFIYCTGLTSAENLVLPATTLVDNCYQAMFQNCTSLTTAPELPATTLADNCYKFMFLGCTSLTSAPALPATTLAGNCYSSMFRGCTSLTTAPELPATTLAQYCYSYMFSNCTSLTTAPELPATTLAENCYNSMFQRCTSLTTAPVLPATTLASYCYSTMFQNCTNLNYIKCLATDVSASYCTRYWVLGVQTASGTFVKNSSMTSWTRGTSGIPTNWTVQDAS